MLRTPLSLAAVLVPFLASAQDAAPPKDAAPKNRAPTAAPLALTTDEDTPASAQLIGADEDGDALTFRISAPAKRGTVTVDENTGALVYTPKPNLHGPDTFTVSVSDGKLRALAAVSVTVTPQNDAPTAAPLALQGKEDEPLSAAIRAADLDKDTLVYTLEGAPAHGSATVDPTSGALRFTPEANWAGTDALSVTVKDASASVTVPVTIAVASVNDAPKALPLTLELDEDTSATQTASASDADGDALTWSIAVKPRHGALTLEDAQSGRVSYSPARDFAGPDVFVLQASDGKLVAKSAAQVTVRPHNDAPTVKPLVLKGAEDASVRGTVLANDVDKDPLRYAIGEAAARGTASVDEKTGLVLYAPQADAHGDDRFTVVVSDASASASAEVTVSLAPQNDAPIARNAALTVDEDASAEGTVDASDKDGDALRFSVVKPPTQGALDLDATSGRFRYTPRPDRNGADAFEVSASDGALRATAKVDVTIAPQPDAPVTADLALKVAEDRVGTVRAVATDKDGDALTWRIAEPPAHASAAVTDAKTGAISVKPELNFHGADALVLEVTDQTGSARARVNLEVTPENDAPLPTPVSVSTGEDSAAELTLAGTDVDGDALRFSIARPPAHGKVTLTDAATGAARFEPAPDWHGTDTFAFEVSDGKATTRGEASVTVRPENDAPRAPPLALRTNEDAAARARINATDPDGDALRFELAEPPQHGSVTVDATSGAIGYTPSENVHGADAFTVRVSDAGASAMSKVSVTILPVNDAPSANAASFTLAEDTTLSDTLAASDPEGDALTFSVVRPPRRGTLTLERDGRVSFKPAADAHGADSFSFAASDGALRSVAEVTLQVAQQNDAPLVRASALTLLEDTPARGNVSWSDVDGDKPTFSLVEPPHKGDVVVDAASGAFTFTPARDQNGADAFSLRVTDGQADATARVTLDIRTVPDPPVTRDEALRVVEDEPADAVLPAQDPDGDALTFRLTTKPALGTLTLVDAKSGAVRYAPHADVSGADTAGFEVSDGKQKVSAVVKVEIAPKNDAPEATGVELSTQEDVATVATIAMRDKDGDKLSLEVVTQPEGGKASIEDAAAGRVRFEPARDRGGDMSFTVAAFDGQLRSAPVSVRVKLDAVNDAPVVKSATVETSEDVGARGRLFASDVDGDRLSFKVDAQIPLGTLKIENASTGDYAFVPATNKFGEGVVRFSVSDGTTSAASFVRVRVSAVDDRPLATAMKLSAPRIGRVQKTLLGYDPDGSPVRFSIASAPSFGSVELLDDRTGAFLFVTDGSYTGVARFSFVVKDGTLESAPAIVEIEVR